MYPTLFHLFGYPVQTYGFFMAVAHLSGIALLLAAARRDHLPIEDFVDLIFVVLFFGLLGARVGYAATHWEEFRGNPASLLSLSKGGLAFFSGFLAAFFPFLLFLRWRGLPALVVSDLVSPVMPFSLALIRLGCLGAGCCYGIPTHLPWGLRFSAGSRVPAELAGQALHPTQVYEASVLLLLAGLLLWAQRRRAFHPGVLATLSVGAYATYRFFADFLRGDVERGILGISWLSLSQLAGLLGMAATPLVLWLCVKQSRSSHGQENGE